MPVTYTIDAASGIIDTRCAGPVTLPQVLAHFDDLAADPRTARVPVIVVTGTDWRPHRPPSAMLVKPVNPDRLASVIRRVVAVNERGLAAASATSLRRLRAVQPRRRGLR